MKTGTCLINHTRINVHRNRKKKDNEEDGNTFFHLLKKELRTLLNHLPAMVFTGALITGGSYLFFIQLAEYGW